MAASGTPAVNTRITITSKSINGDSVASVFNQVLQLEFDYFKGMIRILDQAQGEFFFGLTLVTVTTVTIVAGVSTTVVIS